VQYAHEQQDSPPFNAAEISRSSLRFDSALFFFYIPSAKAQPASEANGENLPACNAEAAKAIDQTSIAAANLIARRRIDAAENTYLDAIKKTPETCRTHTVLVARLALLQVQTGNLKEGNRNSEAAVKAFGQLGDHSEDAAVAEYVLGGGYFLSGQADLAEKTLQRAAKRYAQLSVPNQAMVAKIYSDLAIVSIRRGRVEQARKYMSQARYAAGGAITQDHTEQVLQEDALAHLEYSSGRISEAFRLYSNLVHTYGADISVTKEFRAHIYQDYGEICLRAGQLEESSTYLTQSLALFKDQNINTVSIAMVEGSLAKLFLLQHDGEQAQSLATQAVNTLGKKAEEYPLHAATIQQIAGNVMRYQKHWEEARMQYWKAVQSAAKTPDYQSTGVAALQGLGEADRHLHRKQEGKEVRQQLKEALARSWSRNNEQKDTVDVMSLKQDSTSSYRAGR
jgi:tetratricopeptide (TPR) repeat protein